MHYNIAKKQEINPFENVKYIKLSSFSKGFEILLPIVNSSEEVITRKINGSWVILYPVESLNFTTVIKWLEPLRGKFYVKHNSIHFSIEEDILSCW